MFFRSELHFQQLLLNDFSIKKRFENSVVLVSSKNFRLWFGASK